MSRMYYLTALLMAATSLVQGLPRSNLNDSLLSANDETYRPHPKSVNITDKNLFTAFYREALEKYNQDDFIAAGFDASFYLDVQDILADQEEHVQFYTNALEAANEESLSECTYKFPYTDVQSFVTLATMIEGIGVSALLGEAGKIANTTLQAKTASITAAEAEHFSQEGNKVGIKTSSAFGLASMDFNPIYSLAEHFVVECPSGNTILPLDKFPTLIEKSLGPYNHNDKNKVTFAFKGIDVAQHYIIWFTPDGLVTVPVSVLSTSRFEVEIPPSESIKGQIYAVLTDRNITQEEVDVDDSIIVAGPNIIWVE